MKFIKAFVTTNSEDDDYMRVKVKSEFIWQQESELLSSLNSIPLEKDDVVIVMYDTLANPLILGKYNSFEQDKPISGQELFISKNGDNWILGTISSTELAIQSSKDFKVKGFYEDLSLETPNGSKFYLKDDNVSIELAQGAKIESDGTNITISSTAGKIQIKNTAASLYSLLDDLVTTLGTTTPTTQGSPAAQVFNPTIIAKCVEVKAKLALLMQ